MIEYSEGRHRSMLSTKTVRLILLKACYQVRMELFSLMGSQVRIQS